MGKSTISTGPFSSSLCLFTRGFMNIAKVDAFFMFFPCQVRVFCCPVCISPWSSETPQIPVMIRSQAALGPQETWLESHPKCEGFQTIWVPPIFIHVYRYIYIYIYYMYTYIRYIYYMYIYIYR